MNFFNLGQILKELIENADLLLPRHSINLVLYLPDLHLPKIFLTHRITSKLFNGVRKGIHRLIFAVSAPYSLLFSPCFLLSSHNDFSESPAASCFLLLGCHTTCNRSSPYFQTWMTITPQCGIWILDQLSRGQLTHCGGTLTDGKTDR